MNGSRKDSKAISQGASNWLAMGSSSDIDNKHDNALPLPQAISARHNRSGAWVG